MFSRVTVSLPIADKTGISLDELYELNEGLNENSVIMPDDIITITVPTPELSVVVKARSHIQ